MRVIEIKLLSIGLSNYRQYNGVQKIEIGTDETKNFTIIEGANGSGKTNILNAITWCLYGEEDHLSQNSSVLPIVNERRFIDLRENSSIECKVKLIFGEENPELSVTRSILAKKIKGEKKIFLHTPRFDVLIKTRDGWDPAPDPEFLVSKKIAPSKIRKFFFFDGERLDSFFRANGDEQIKEAILDVAQVGLLDKAKGHLDKVILDLRKDVSKNLPELEELVKDIEDSEQTKNDFDQRIKDNDERKKKIESIIKEIEDVLRDHPIKLINELQRKRDQLITDQEQINLEIKETQMDYNNYCVYTIPFILSKNAINASLDLIKKESKQGRVPPIIRDYFIKELLDSGKCICGTNISMKAQDRSYRKEIESLLTNILPSELVDLVDDGKYKLENLNKKSSDFIKKIKEYNNTLEKLYTREEQNKRDINEITADMGKSDSEEIAAKETQRQKYLKERDELLQENASLNQTIIAVKKSIKEFKIKYDKITKEKTKINEVNKQVSLGEKISDFLTQQKEELIELIREEIESKTKKYFFELIWKKDAFSEIKISPDYNISIFSKAGTSCLGSLSAGERQILALAFTAALYKVSGFNAPVIIDTPFARISSEPRKNIAMSLPDYLKGTQITLVVTDTEYTKDLREHIRKKVGKEYKLNFDQTDGVTVVVPYDKKETIR